MIITTTPNLITSFPLFYHLLIKFDKRFIFLDISHFFIYKNQCRFIKHSSSFPSPTKFCNAK
jgi:hypothetical protein